MNREQYNSDPRYAKVLETMDLLGIMDVTTTRQHKNGTIIWKLPIKINYPGNKERLIEVGSFSTGYVRNQNCGYSNYQLNKRCEGEPEYFKLSNGDYRKFTTRACVLIPVEIDRLEYLLKYCVKNYYIKNANQVPNGDFIPKWQLEHTVSSSNNDFNGHRDRIKDLEERLSLAQEDLSDVLDKRDSYKKEYKNRTSEVNDLQNKLNTIKRIASYE